MSKWTYLQGQGANKGHMHPKPNEHYIHIQEWQKGLRFKVEIFLATTEKLM